MIGQPAKSEIEWVHQFLIVLQETDPLVWRRIEVPDDYSFWDLHVAIQDAMGWTDSHLHEFAVVHSKSGRLERLGIPDDNDEDARRPDWKFRLSEYLGRDSPPMAYLYDFGDSWDHAVVHEGRVPVKPSVQYPRCVSGARKCPPEDCGGTRGYREFLEAIGDPEHGEHERLLVWVGGAFDPDTFDPARVVFDDPQERWENAFTRD